MRTGSALSRYQRELNAGVVADMQQWRDDQELAKLLIGLESVRQRQRFFSIYAEALIARHLVQQGCDVRVEVPTPGGRSCDFEISSGDQRFYLHVKHINTDRPTDRHLTVSSRLRYLERIARPYIVHVRWHDPISDDRMQRLVVEAASFIQQARLGDELVVRDDSGREIGGCLIAAPAATDHVSLTIGLPEGFINEVPRMQRQLRKAYRQFMAGEVNVILIATHHADDVVDFETALLGSHVERWDAMPARGERIAHGRDDDGFWSHGQYADSNVGGWFCIGPNVSRPDCHLWLRSDSELDEGMADTLRRLFGRDTS